MSSSLQIASPSDPDRLNGPIPTFYAGKHLSSYDESIRAALSTLLDGSPHGAVYRIGPAFARIGYAMIIFGWPTDFGDVDACPDETCPRPAMRGRGIVGEGLNALAFAPEHVGVTADFAGGQP
ncbi:MAG: GNAT family N-acetyltransferase [Rhodobacteraceae bacterium]|nr:GNAT family N-acetyltransferase [Paracoccaceae bacterium]